MSTTSQVSVFTLSSKVYVSRRLVREENGKVSESPAEVDDVGITDTLRICRPDGVPVSSVTLALPSILTLGQHITHLNLEYTLLTTIPASLFLLHQLHAISLCHNRLTHIPPGVACWGRLTSLLLNHNEIHTIDDRIGTLRKLRKLDLSWNNIQSLPFSILKLKHLGNIWLDGCPMVNRIMAYGLQLDPPVMKNMDEGTVATLGQVAIQAMGQHVWSLANSLNITKSHSKQLLEALGMEFPSDKPVSEELCLSLLIQLPEEVQRALCYLNLRKQWIEQRCLTYFSAIQRQWPQTWPVTCAGCSRITFSPQAFKEVPMAVANKILMLKFYNCGAVHCRELILREYRVDLD
jgi:hypothetical protein